MKNKMTYTLILAAALQAGPAQAGPYNFGGSCPSQGAWTQMALQQTQAIATAVRQLKDNPACKGITSVVTNLQAAANALEVPSTEVNRSSRFESLPGETAALRKAVMKGGKVNKDTASMLLNRTLETAGLSAELNASQPARQSDLAKFGKTLSSIGGLFTKYAAPTQKGLELITGVMQALPEYDECLIGQPRQAMAIVGGAIKVAAAFSAAGEGVGDKLGNAVASLGQMMRDRRFTQTLRKLDEVEFWFSISCLLESTAKNYCEAQNAQDIMEYSKDQYQAAMKRNLADRKSATYDNPLEGYYLLVRELPTISAWLQKVQFGVAPKLSSDAAFKNKIWDQVTDMTKAVNELSGFFNEQMLFIKELPDTESKRNRLMDVLEALVNKMSGGDSSQFFTTTVNPTLLPFKLIGRDSIPIECRVSETRLVAQEWSSWMRTGNDGNFIADFNDPDKLAMTIQTRMNEIIAGASTKQSAYFRQRLVMDMPNLVNQTLTGQYLTVRKAFENVFNYLVRFENRLNKDNMDVILIPSVRETKVKIQKFLKSYDQLHELGVKVAKSETTNEAVIKEVDKAAQTVLDTVFNEFNVLFQKDTFLTNRLTTFIEKDFSARVRAGLNMSPYQQDLLIITQKNLLDKLTEVHGLNPTSSQIDLARAQVINKTNLNAFEDIFGDSIYRMILEMKAVASGKGSASIQKSLDKRFNEQRRIMRKLAWKMPSMGNFGINVWMWLTAGQNIRNKHPDLYDGRGTVGATSSTDDNYKSYSQLQAMFCAQSLAFENREQYREICEGTQLKSYYSQKDTASALDLRYNDYINNVAKNTKASYSGKNICAYEDFTIRNLVQWMRDQDSEMYQDMTVQFQ